MPVWTFPLILGAILVLVLAVSRVKIPRDTQREGLNDYESTLAYDQVSRGLIFDFLRFLMLNRLTRLCPQGILVDAGCGPGNLALVIAQRYPLLQIVGFDFSRQMSELATQKLFGRNRNRVTFPTADVASLPLRDNSIDFAVSTLSLHHWVKPEMVLNEIHRVLKPGGQALIFDIRRDEPLLVYWVGQIVQRFFTPYHIRRVNGAIGSIWSSYTPTELKSLISKSPFKSGRVQAGWAWIYVWGSKSAIGV